MRFGGVLVSGSLAYDRIFDFPGKFRSVILPEKLHLLNVSFTVNEVKESYGGTAGNIAYSLALLGIKAHVVSSAGDDFQPYRQWLSSHRVDLNSVQVVPTKKTASAYIITDRDDNQIAAFYAGAMLEHKLDYARLARIKKNIVYAILSPGNTRTMIALGKYYTKFKLPFFFDPGQVIPMLHPKELRFLLQHCLGFISNDYELDLVAKRAKVTPSRLRKALPLTITTLGSKGLYLSVKGARRVIPAARARYAVDPTGAGDAFRSGFIAGLVRGAPIVTAARMGAVSSLYTVEKKGTQTHFFTWNEFARRFHNNFSDHLPN